MRKKTLPLPLQKKLKLLVKKSPSFKLVHGRGFLYFSIQPAQEDINYTEVLNTSNLHGYSVVNRRQDVVGYFLLVKGKPRMNLSEYGAALFYSKRLVKYKKMKILFSDQKLRVVAFDTKDFFISAKWKSVKED